MSKQEKENNFILLVLRMSGYMLHAYISRNEQVNRTHSLTHLPQEQYSTAENNASGTRQFKQWKD